MQSSQQSRRDGDDERHGDLHVRLALALRNARTGARDGQALRKLLSLRIARMFDTRVHGSRAGADVVDADSGLGKHERHMR